MARGKKKESTLTPEEKLAQALVPVEEQPYQVPENWGWTKQGSVSKFLNGRAYKQTELLEDDTLTPVLRVGNLFTNGSWYYSDLSLDESKYIKSSDLIYAWSASFGPFIWQGGRVIYHYHIWKVELSEVLNKQFYYYWLMNDTERLKGGGHGTGMIHVTKEMMEQSIVPVPPLAEQQRIVDRIESLFAKLDEAKEKAQSVLDSFETRKAAILHKAFTGELTAKWRAEHVVEMDSWNMLTLNDVAAYKKGPFGSSITKAMFVPKGANTYKVYEQGNAIRKTLDYGHYYISKAKYEELKGFAVAPGDILISCAGTIGEAYKLPDNCEAGVINQALMRVRIFPNIHEQFFLYYFGGVVKGDVIDKANGTAIQNIPPFKVMKAMEIHLPTIEEQTEIVRILDSLFTKEQQAKEAAEAVLEKIDLLKKSILARAFRGELGTNDPTEESALELLKSIL